MKTFLFLLLAIWTFIVVFFRRIFKGPLHPGWTYRFEAIAEVVRDNVASSLGLPVEKLRKEMLPTRVHPSLRKSLKQDRTPFAGRPAETFTPHDWTPEKPTLL